MKIPASPPQFTPQPPSSDEDRNKLLRILRDGKPLDDKGRYLHWDELRFKPTPDGLSVEEHWYACKFARQRNASKTPFDDKHGSTFWYVETTNLKKALHEFDTECRGTLTGSDILPGKNDGHQYFIQTLLEEPFHSSLLEGAATTREIAKKLVSEQKVPSTESEKMVLNNYLAMQFIKEQRTENLTLEIIHELHRIITQDTLEKPEMAGVFRGPSHKVDVGNEITGETYHIPPDANELESRMQKLCDFANIDSDVNFIHPIVKAIILHFMLAYEHPYVDGNGRTARALFYWYVVKHGYWLLEYISISKVILGAKSKYGLAFLHTETDEADLTYFLLHQSDAIKASINALKKHLKVKQAELQETSQALNDLKGKTTFNSRQIEVIAHASKNQNHPFTVPTHQKTYGVTYVTARKDLENLKTIGLFTKKREGKTFVYKPIKEFNLLIQQMTGNKP